MKFFNVLNFRGWIKLICNTAVLNMSLIQPLKFRKMEREFAFLFLMGFTKCSLESNPIFETRVIMMGIVIHACTLTSLINVALRLLILSFFIQYRIRINLLIRVTYVRIYNILKIFFISRKTNLKI